MRFAFTEDQLAFRDTVRDLLERECPPAIVRDAWTNETGRTPTVWGHLAEMGVLGALAPESAGGLGLTFLDLVLVLEETGYAALPEPILEHAAIAVPLLPDPTPAATGDVTVTASFVAAPYAPWSNTADLLVVEDESGLRVVEPSEVQSTSVTSVDRARRLFAVDAAPSSGIH